MSRSVVESDYDEFYGELLAEAIDGAVAGLSPERRAELAELDDLDQRLSDALKSVGVGTSTTKSGSKASS